MSTPATTRAVTIRGAVLVRDEGLLEADVRIEDGRIADIGTVSTAHAEEIDGSGLHLLPGVVDAHVHFREPGLTHKECLATATAAALKGGVTSFLEMPNTAPATIDRQRLDEKLALAAASARAHYGFYIGATLDNLAELVAAERTPGIKIFVGSSTGNMLVDDQEVLERIFAETTLPICVHAEDEAMVLANAARLAHRRDAAAHSEVRHPEAAARSVARVVDLATRHRHRLHVLHVSTRGELDALPAPAGDGTAPLVSAEVCYPHLFLDEGAYAELDCFAKINPPLRAPEEREAMWPALRAGRFWTIGSDHAPHLPEEKRKSYPAAPSGMPSVENGLPLMLDAASRGLVPLTLLPRLMSRQPAQLWGLRGKGAIELGYDADLVLVDLQREAVVRGWQQWTRCGWSAFEGRTLRGWPVRTLLLGETAYLDGALVGEPRGRELSFERAAG